MARYAIIENGTVANIALSTKALAENWKFITKAADVQKGDTYDGKDFARPVPSLDDAKLAAWAQAKAKRDATIDGGAAVPGIGTFDSDEASRTNIIGSVLMALIAEINLQPFAVKWTLADNTVAVLDAAQMIAVGAAVFQHVAGVHETAQVTRAEIEAAKDHTEIPKIDELFTAAALL